MTAFPPTRLETPAEALAEPVAPRARARWQFWYAGALAVADVTAALMAALVAFLVRGQDGGLSHVELFKLELNYELLGVVCAAVWVFGLAVAGAYQPRFSAEELRDYRVSVVVAMRIMGAVTILSYALQVSLSRMVVLVYFPALMAWDLALRWIVRRSLAVARSKGNAAFTLLVVGDAPSVKSFVSHLRRTGGGGYKVAGACVREPVARIEMRDGDVPVVGHPDAVVEAAREIGADAVAVANPGRFQELNLQRLAWNLERSGIDLLVAPDVVDVAGPRIRVAPLTGLPMLHITEPRIDTLGRRAVAFASRMIAVPLVLVASPVLIAVALAVLITSGRPIFFRQERVGYRGQTFSMLKFRTMVPNAEKLLVDLRDRNEHDGPLFKIKEDPRVTGVGRWLRKYSLDEIPQLLNVLRGDMVFVGPRPCLTNEIEMFGETEHRRFFAKPGLTGLWQVSGRSRVAWEDAVRLDLYYVDNWSPGLDLLIILRTLRVVLAGTGY